MYVPWRGHFRCLSKNTSQHFKSGGVPSLNVESVLAIMDKWLATGKSKTAGLVNE